LLQKHGAGFEWLNINATGAYFNILKMKKKRILIFSGDSIFPIIGMHQVRIFNQIKSLSADHDVHCMFLYTKEIQKNESIKSLSLHCNKIIPYRTFTQSLAFRILKKLLLKRVFSHLAYPLDYFESSNIITARLIANRISQENYDIVISHYWQASGVLKYLPEKLLKCIDTHYLVEENLDLYRKGYYKHINKANLGYLLNKELQLQNICFTNAGLLIVNSKLQKEILDTAGVYQSICIPNGQDLIDYLDYSPNDTLQDNNLLFYGALSNQFNQKALKRMLNAIFPQIRKVHHDIRLIIMGSGAPEWLIKLAGEEKAIEVTGFVEDVRPVFQRSLMAIIPLESGSGFRGRVIELLASGVPVIGTTNALNSVGLDHGINGLITDSDEEIVSYALQLIGNANMRHKLSMEGKEFVRRNYSLEATFGRLSQFFTENPTI